ncbi:MAG: FAD-dependent thymidylate synthase [Oscillospiraceae bacterium]|jgi:thymidylate synthase (FAD)|nr:FAD-dependent thymidylate synthase [Oscillospiraceae bacterium]
MPKVSLISYTKESELLVALAAKLCYSADRISDLKKNFNKENSEKFLNMLLELGHESPLEHASFTFAIENVSRALLAQITRHRIASFSVQSQRYVNEDNFSYVVPPEIEKSLDAKEEFVKAMKECKEHYLKLSSILSNIHKKNLIANGKSKSVASETARKMAIEDARFVLPNACTTKMFCTFNARSLMNFFKRRLCNRAQWEIRNLAILMLKSVLKVAPILFSKIGPSCVFDNCCEGKMSCGKQVDVKKFFLELATEKQNF